MREVIFKTSSGFNTRMSTVFTDVPELETILEEWNFKYESRIDDFIDILKRYLIIETDLIAPMAIITDKIMGVSIRHNGQKYYLIIKEIKGGE